jgi:tetratricopeptide (TPR) repeat protein
LEAVATYERGVAALQRREFALAAERFREVLERYPEERELHERARLYLRVCERQLERREPAVPQTPEERIFAATLAINAGRDDEAFEHLTRAVSEDPANGSGHYMLAIVLARRGDTSQALEHLKRAIELDPEHRALARREADFDTLRGDEAFRALVEPAAPKGAGRRAPKRRRLR